MNDQPKKSRRFSLKETAFLTAVAVAFAATVLIGSCGGGGSTSSAPRTSTRTQTATTATATTAKKPVVPGITLDPALQSVTGIPSPEDMRAFIELQKQMPYPVIVPTELPSGYTLEKDLIGYGGRNETDPVGYYSFRYSDPSNPNRSLTFNQSLSNAEPLSGYYLTEEEINGVTYQVYWHKTRDYLPEGAPVRTTAVEDAETFVVVWPGQYTDPLTGQPQQLWYSITSGTWVISWGDVQAVLASLKPLSAVGQ